MKPMAALRGLLPGAGAVLLAASCSGFEPFDPPSHRDDPEMPGLFSGERGEFVIHRRGSDDDSPPKSGSGAARPGD
jgi:hypothetical protein